MRNRREFVKGVLGAIGLGAVLPFVLKPSATEEVTVNRVFAVTDNADLTEFCDAISGMRARERGRAFQAVAKMIGLSPEVNDWGEIYTAPGEILNDEEVVRHIEWCEGELVKSRQCDWDYEKRYIVETEENIARLRALQKRRASFDIYEHQKDIHIFAET